MKVSRLLVGLFAGALSFAVYAQQPIVIKFSHVVAKDPPRAWPPNTSPRRRKS